MAQSSLKLHRKHEVRQTNALLVTTWLCEPFAQSSVRTVRTGGSQLSGMSEFEEIARYFSKNMKLGKPALRHARHGHGCANRMHRMQTVCTDGSQLCGRGNRATKYMHLLSDTTTTDDEDNPTGEVLYSFSKGMREIIKQSRHWGRIKAYVMFAFTSKYSLALYELLCLRANLRKDEQEFTFEDLRQRLGVAAGKLDRAPDFLRRVIHPAVEEVNALSDYRVEIEVLRDGGLSRGKLRGFRVRWERKEPEEWSQTLDELMRPKVGRRARIQGTVETVF